jgi:lysozyme
MNLRRGCFAYLAAMMLPCGPTFAQSAYDRPWQLPDVPIVMDPYGGNSIDWRKAATDPRVKAVIHKASQGLSEDPQFVAARAGEAKARGFLWGAYHLGKPGDPIKQATFFLRLATKTGATFLAIDIEDDNPAKFMSITDAAKFIGYVHTQTGKYPAIYVNWSLYNKISHSYGKESIFAKAPLWVARFRSKLGTQNTNIWTDYTLWQFSSEINCSKNANCFYHIPGTLPDMDVNVFHGTAEQLKALFN